MCRAQISIAGVLGRCKFLYYPAYRQLAEHAEMDVKPYVQLKRPRAPKGVLAGFSRAPTTKSASGQGQETQDEWAREHRFLLIRLGTYLPTLCRCCLILEADKVEAAEAEAKRMAHETALAEGNGLECGCCFGDEILVSYPIADQANK